MGTQGILAALLLSLFAISCATPAPVAVDSSVATQSRAPAAAHQIVLTFVDSSINRISSDGPGTGYRPRGNYQTTTWGGRVSAELAEEYQLRIIDEWPITTLGVHCVVYEVSARRSLDQLLGLLARDQRIESAQRMNQFHVLGGDPYYRLQTSLRSMQIEQAHHWATGRNITVAMIDTGVDFHHPDLADQISQTEDFVTHDPSVFIDDIHGTAVAGVIVARADNGKGIVGIAPNAELAALKACWAERPDSTEAVCDTLSLAKALDAAIRLKPQILNLSLTGPSDPLLERLVSKAIESHIIVVAADPGVGSSNSFPTSIASVVRARSSDSYHYRIGTTQADTISSLVAPGSDVLTTFPHDTYNFISGSSVAAAHVSGVTALLLELQPDLSPSQIVKLLQTTAIRAVAYHHTGSYSPSVVDACAAIAKLRGMQSCWQG